MFLVTVSVLTLESRGLGPRCGLYSPSFVGWGCGGDVMLRGGCWGRWQPWGGSCSGVWSWWSRAKGQMGGGRGGSSMILVTLFLVLSLCSFLRTPAPGCPQDVGTTQWMRWGCSGGWKSTAWAVWWWMSLVIKVPQLCPWWVVDSNQSPSWTGFKP